MTTEQTTGQASRYGALNLKKAAWHFLLGKSVGAFCGMLSTILIVRWLTPPEYAAYVLLLSLTLLLVALSSFGLPDVAQRFLPELIIHKKGKSFTRVLFWILLVRIAAMVVAVTGFYLLAPWMSVFFDQEAMAWSFKLNCLVIVSLSLFQFSCLLLETLLLQVLLKWVFMGAAILKLLLIFLFQYLLGGLVLREVLYIDALSYGLAALPALLVAAKYALTHREERPFAHSMADSQNLLSRIVPFAAYSYLVFLAYSLQGGPINKLIVGAVLPVATLAIFGFAQTMADYLHSYMPNMLLLNTVRPVVIARWSETRDKLELMTNANMFFKLNLVLLLPILSWLALCSTPLARIISNGKYTEGGSLLLALCALLLFQIHNRRYDLALQALERTKSLLRGNLFVVGSVILAALLTQIIGEWGVVLASLCGFLARDTYLHIILARCGVDPSLSILSLTKQFVAAVLAALIIWPMLPEDPGVIAVLLAGAGCLLLFLLFHALLRPFTENERNALHHLTRLRIPLG